ncbi:LuxR family transcriptional regulator [Actinoallomurus acanthiterrae]
MNVVSCIGQVGNLPADVTSLVDRRHEVAEVKRLLSTSRLVTLTGVGGVGKTRLALQAARELHRAFDEVWLAELASLTDPSLVTDTVAAAVGFRDQTARPPLPALAGFLAERRILLVLDNCEHLLDSCAVVTDALLRAAPWLRVLATSRQSLGIHGESTMTVLPLAVPDPDRPPPSVQALEEYSSASLFAERAAAVVPQFAIDDDNLLAVTRVCHQLEGIPLAIELAAGRLRALSVDGLAARLADRYRCLTGGSRASQPRQQTLRALMDWSFRLLSPAEQTLWARLSVFCGRFDLGAAEAVCVDGEIPHEEVLDLLDGMVNKSLLLREESADRVHYRMLDTLRQFGLAELADSGAAVARRHRDWYLRLAEQAASEWFGPEQLRWCDRLRLEQPNLRAALEFCLTEPGEAEAGLRIAAALHHTHWHANSLFSEGRNWLDRLLCTAPDPSPARAKVLYVGAWLALMQGDGVPAHAMLEECGQLARWYDDGESLAYVAHLSALAALHRGDNEEGTRLCQEGRDLFAANGDLLGIVMSDLALAVALGERGEGDRAVELCEKCLALTEDHGEDWCRAYALTVLAIEAWHQRDTIRAASLAREGLLAGRAFGDRLGIAVSMEVLAWIATTGADPQRAALLLGASDAIARNARMCVLRVGRYIGYHDWCEERLRRELGECGFGQVFERGSRLTVDEAIKESLGERPAEPESAPAACRTSPLTRRETEVAALVAEGMSNKQIAAKLVIAQRTAEGHVERILDKLGFTSRTQIAIWVTGGTLRRET